MAPVTSNTAITTSYAASATAHIEAVKSNAATAHMDDAIVHIEVVTAHAAPATSHVEA